MNECFAQSLETLRSGGKIVDSEILNSEKREKKIEIEVSTPKQIES